MTLWDKLKGGLVEIIEWTDDSRDTIVWRFPRYENEIKMGAKQSSNQPPGLPPYGLAAWTAAGQVPELGSAFAAVPPPLSGQL